VLWLKDHGVTLDATALAEGILTDGYLTGAASAAAVLNGSTTADLGGWKPGDTGAAQDQVGALGAAGALSALLSAQAAQAAERITGGILAALARTLAGTDGDAEPGKTGTSLRDVIATAALAAGLVFAEICSAVTAAMGDYYTANAPTAVFAWVTDPTLENCPICLDNEAAEPRPWGDAWPSGDTTTGIHIKCGCALVTA
jgi:hypothetical protein